MSRQSKAAYRNELADLLSKLGSARISTFHTQLNGQLIRLSTRPSVHAADLARDPNAITAWIEDGQVLAVDQSKFHLQCHNKPSWKREGQYNLMASSVGAGIVRPILEVLRR